MENTIVARSLQFQNMRKDLTEQYWIPSLQRPYVWEAKKHVKKFLEDILSNEKNYFIGSIVVITAKEGSTGREEVIDGQQRLSTISIMLIALQDIIKQHKNLQEVDNILREINTFLRYKDGYDDREIIRLEFSDKKTNEYFTSLLKGEEKKEETETQKKIFESYKFIRTELKKELIKDNELNIQRLNNFFEKIKTLLIIGIKCENSSIAYELFESINATGLSLASVDLIKNYIFKKLKDDQEKLEKAENLWENLENTFAENRALLKTFLRHYWISKGNYVSHAGLFKEVEKKYENNEGELMDFISELEEDGKIYLALRKADSSELNKMEGPVIRFEKGDVIDVLNFLSFLNVDQVYAPILYFYKNKDISKFKKFLNKLVAFQFLYKYIPGSPSVAEKVFANMVNPENENFQKLIELTYQQKDNFKKKFVEKAIYRGGKTGDLQFVLERYIFSKGGAKGFHEPTIEHIISQKNNRDHHIHKIGNLTILEREINSKLPEKFEDKKKVYASSSYTEHQEIVENYDFSRNYIDSINKRSEDIADKTFDIFSKMLQDGKIISSSS